MVKKLEIIESRKLFIGLVTILEKINSLEKKKKKDKGKKKVEG